MAEFNVKNALSETTKRTPFFAIQWTDPSMSVPQGLMEQSDHRCLEPSSIQAVMQHVIEHHRVEMTRTQATQAEGGNWGQIPATN